MKTPNERIESKRVFFPRGQVRLPYKLLLVRKESLVIYSVSFTGPPVSRRVLVPLQLGSVFSVALSVRGGATEKKTAKRLSFSY